DCLWFSRGERSACRYCGEPDRNPAPVFPSLLRTGTDPAAFQSAREEKESGTQNWLEVARDAREMRPPPPLPCHPSQYSVHERAVGRLRRSRIKPLPGDHHQYRGGFLKVSNHYGATTAGVSTTENGATSTRAACR